MSGYREGQDLHVLHREATREATVASTASPSGAPGRGGRGTLRTAPVRTSTASSRGARAYLDALRRLGADPEVLDEARRGWPGERRRTPRAS
ncbi:hypothetical protein [Vallicoccus soli]|uniref:Uncharacterized protein n=1 Tax=Vallicoccus soli TaxID=2339232 RepID=A0A3A3Z0M2_9ACTN|nr:hypothetical protein [Vallicoccus soli]RJK96795.1 hypothetical protein D5H78_05865 [Vallicoccus soli]